MAEVRECRECGGDSYPWEFDGMSGWSCEECGSDEIVDELVVFKLDHNNLETKPVEGEDLLRWLGLEV